MSMAMQVEINELKAKVEALEAALKAKVEAGETVAKADWQALVARIEAMEHTVAAFGAKVKGRF